MALSRSDLVAHLAVLLIVASIAMIGVELTGRVVDTGTVNITIVSAASINFTIENVNWGAGQVDQGQTLANLTTDSVVTNGNWTAVGSGLVLENNGNVNVIVNFSSGTNAAGFIGGSNPIFQYRVSNNESNSCTGNLANWVDLSGATQPGCTFLNFTDTNDQVEIDLLLSIPYDASGVKGTTITANATAV